MSQLIVSLLVNTCFGGLKWDVSIICISVKKALSGRVFIHIFPFSPKKFQKGTRRTEREYMTKHSGNYRSSYVSGNVLFHSCLDSARKHLKRNLHLNWSFDRGP